MQTRPIVISPEEVDAVEGDAWREEAFFGDTDFAKATLEGMAAFAAGEETILLEELRAEVA